MAGLNPAMTREQRVATFKAMVIEKSDGGTKAALTDFEKLDIKPAVRPKILKENAARLLGLTKETVK